MPPASTPPPPIRKIAATLVAVGPRATDPQHQTFALLVSAGAVVVDASAELRRSCLPWTWVQSLGQSLAIKAWAVVAGQPAPVALEASVIAINRTPAVDSAQLANVRGWFEPAAPTASATAAPAAIDPRFDRPDSELRGHDHLVPTLGEQLAQLSTYPGDLPQRLNLVTYFTVKLPVGAAVIDLRGATLYAIPDLADARPTETPVVSAVDIWSPSATSATLTTNFVANALRLDAALTAGALGPDLATYWLRVASAQPGDWGDDLSARCLEASNTFARLAEPVRGNASAAATQAVLDALLANAGVDPWATIHSLVTANGGAVPTLPRPTRTLRQIATRWLGLSGPDVKLDELLALPASAPEDVLIWCWHEWSGAAPPVQPDLVIEAVLRDGIVGKDADPTTPRGAAAAHRERARALAEAIIAPTPPDPDPASTPYSRAITATHALLDPLLPAELAETIRGYVASLWTALAPTAPSPREAKPSGLTMQFDALEIGVGEHTPIWDQLAGIGVLVRRCARDTAVWGPWRLLNASSVELRESSAPLFAPDADGAAAAIIPYRLTTRDGVRYPFVTYEHRSLVTETAIDTFIGAQYDTAHTSEVTAKIRYANPMPSPRWSRDLVLPPLRYGDKYELAAFAIDLAGGMPAEITHAAPFVAKSFVWGRDPAAELAGIGAFGLGRDSLSFDLHQRTSTLTYLRRVPVGALRVRRVDTRAVPDVPDDIQPLARTFAPADDATQVPLIVREGWIPQPLVALEVNVPAVDIDVLERWLGVAAIRAARIVHLDGIDADRAQVVDGPIQPDDRTPTGTAFADPAINSLTIRIDRATIGLHGAVEWTAVAAQLVSCADAQPDHLGKPLTISVSLAPAAAAPTLTGRVVAFTLAVLGAKAAAPNLDLPACVYRVVIELGLTAGAAKRFDVGMSERRDNEAVVLHSYELHLELASRALPTPKHLHGWLTLDPVDDDRAVRLRLVADENDRGVLLNLSSAQVLRHAWRWLGRPRPLWPSIADVQDGTPAPAAAPWPTSQTNIPETLPFDAWLQTAFIDLDPTGERVPPDAIGLPVGRLEVAADASVQLLVDDWHRDGASHLVRYGVRVTSRYGAMIQTATVASSADLAGRTPGWKSVFIPAVLPVVTKPPALMVWLPLTHGRTASDALAPTPALVAFHGPAHRELGISEGMVAELVMGVDYKNSVAADGKPIVEYGRDPINAAGAWHPPIDANTPAMRRVALRGPYGFTFEPASTEPLFATTVYVLEPPFASEDEDSATRSRAGDFAKVRFARCVAEHPDAKQPADAEWSAPVWIHLGRAADALAPRGASIDSLGRVVVPSLGADEGSWLYYVAITRAVTPFGGGPTGEAYVCTATLTQVEGTDVWQTDPLVLPAGELFARVLEVQHSTELGVPPPAPVAPAGEALWTALFPTDAVGAADHVEPHVRIVRISPQLRARVD